jgi:hypothetical protein
MELSDLLGQRLREDAVLGGLLADDQGQPAIFADQPPSGFIVPPGDSYLLYTVDLYEDEKRKNNGTVTVTICCADQGDEVRPIEAAVKACLSHVIVRPAETAYYASWRMTRRQRESGSPTPAVESRWEAKFELFALLEQGGADPDPVAALSKYIAGVFPEAKVPGTAVATGLTELADQDFLIHCNLAGLERISETHVVAWVDCKLNVHIISPSRQCRIQVISALANLLATGDEIRAANDTPMYVKAVVVDYLKDSHRDGQVLVTLNYGLIRHSAKPHTLTGVGMNYE